MANYTSEEIEAVVEQLVRSTIRRPYDTLGVRRTDVTFNDIQEAAAGVFLLYQKTPYYLAFLASSRTSEIVRGIGETCSSLLEALAVLRRRVVPVKDVSALSNAKSALFELESAVSQGKVPKDITKVPAFVRFNQNVDRFLSKVGSNVRDGGQIVLTPQAAKKTIPGLISELKASVEALREQVVLLSQALEDYGQVNLPQLLSTGIVQRARTVLGTRITQLEAMSEVERLEVLRETVLEILGTKAVIKKFGAFQPPSSLSDIQGTGVPFGDEDRPANVAFLESEFLGPYILVTGSDASNSRNVLRVYADGAPSDPAPPTVQFFLPVSQQGRIQGLSAGPFNITAANNKLRFLINGVTTVPVTLTLGPARTALQIASELTTALSAQGYKGEAYFLPLMFDGIVETLPGNILKMPFGQFPSESVHIGDELDIYFGTNAGAKRVVTAVTPSTAAPTQITVNGAALTPATDDRVQYGSPDRRIRVVPTVPQNSILLRSTIQLKGTDDVERQTGISLGMYGDLYAKNQPTDAETVATYITQNNNRVSGETYFVPQFENVLLRTEASSPTTVVMYLFRGQGSWTGGLNVTITATETLPAGNLVGRKVVLREGYEPDAVGTVTARVGQDLSVTFSAPVTAAQGLFEVGHQTGLNRDWVVLVDSGPNAGRYFIDVKHPTIPFQGTLRNIWPLNRDGFAQPLLMTGSVGAEGLRILSRSTATSSEIEVNEVLGVFFSPGIVNATGTTNYFKLPTLPKDLEEGDTLELYVTSYTEPDEERTITRIFSDGVVELSEPISSLTSYPFGVSTVLPFALLRTDKVVKFETYSAALKAWADGLSVSAFFIDLNRFIQPLLANENPTDANVGAAEQKVKELYALLTEAGAELSSLDPASSLEGILGTYSVPQVPEADALIRAFKEKGADRAVDLLLQCRFTAFFGLDQDEVSYAGNLKKALREVARNDLPIRKENRLEANISPLRVSEDSPDYETDLSDLDTTPNIDPPVVIE